MIIHREPGDTEGKLDVLDYEEGDRVIIRTPPSRAMAWNWSHGGPVNAERCIIWRRRPPIMGRKPSVYTDVILVKYHPKAEPAQFQARDLIPHPETLAKAKIVDYDAEALHVPPNPNAAQGRHVIARRQPPTTIEAAAAELRKHKPYDSRSVLADGLFDTRELRRALDELGALVDDPGKVAQSSAELVRRVGAVLSHRAGPSLKEDGLKDSTELRQALAALEELTEPAA